VAVCPAVAREVSPSTASSGENWVLIPAVIAARLNMSSSEVVARVNGEPIRFAQIVPMARREMESDPEAVGESGRNRAVRRALERYIDRELLFQEARARGIAADQRNLEWTYDQARQEHADDEAWEAFLAEEGLDPQAFRTEMRIQHTVSALLEAERGAPTGDDEAREAYEADPSAFAPEGQPPAPFDVVRERVKGVLDQRRLAEVTKRLLEDLRARAKIEVFI
jgi:hypothetical protein